MLIEWQSLTDDRSKPRVLIIAASNFINNIDVAFRRRLSLTLKIDLPNQEERLKILLFMLKGYDVNQNELITFSNNTIDRSPADLKALCASACKIAIRYEYICHYLFLVLIVRVIVVF